MVTAYNLIAYLCKLNDVSKLGLAMTYNLIGDDAAKKSIFYTRCLMYSIAGNMIIRGEY